MGAAYLHFVHPIELTPWVMVALPCVVNIAGQIGDLAESALKRDANMKDSGFDWSGHGGMLDIIDSLIYSVPILFIYLMHKFPEHPWL